MRQTDSIKKLIVELHSLLTFGLDLYQALKILSTEKYSSLILKEMEKGKAFFQSIEKLGILNGLELRMIRSGENSGKLTEAFSLVIEYHELQKEIKRKLIHVVSYPLLISICAIGVSIFMVEFVIPKFEDIYLMSGQKLPGVTLAILNFSNLFKAISSSPLAWLFFALLIGLAHIYRARLKREVVEFSSILPFVGIQVKSFQKLVLFLVWGMQSRAGLTLYESILSSESQAFLRSYKKGIQEIAFQLRVGESVFQAFGSSKLFSDQELNLIKSGEESNSIGSVFESIGNQKINDLKNGGLIAGKLVEPLLMIFIGGLVGFVLIGLYLPLFQINSIF